jgi:hypothetical protein
MHFLYFLCVVTYLLQAAEGGEGKKCVREIATATGSIIASSPRHALEHRGRVEHPHPKAPHANIATSLFETGRVIRQARSSLNCSSAYAAVTFLFQRCGSPPPHRRAFGKLSVHGCPLKEHVAHQPTQVSALRDAPPLHYFLTQILAQTRIPRFCCP